MLKKFVSVHSFYPSSVPMNVRHEFTPFTLEIMNLFIYNSPWMNEITIEAVTCSIVLERS